MDKVMVSRLYICLLCPPSLPIEQVKMSEGPAWNDGFVRTKLVFVSVTVMRLSNQSSSHESVMHYLSIRLYKPWSLVFPQPLQCSSHEPSD